MKKILALTLAVMMMALLAAGCTDPASTTSPSASADPANSTDPVTSPTDNVDPVSILWFHHFGEEGLRIWAEWVAQEVNNRYNNITVNLEVVSADKYQQLLNTKIASDDAPAMFDLGSEILLQEFADAGHLYELTNVPYISNIRQEVIDGGSLKDGRVMALQISMIAYGGYYNKNIFDQVGITETPQTWTTYLEMLQKIKDAGIAPLAAGFKEVWTLRAMMRCDMLNPILTDNFNFFSDAATGAATFSDNQGFKDAMQRFQDQIPYLSEDPFGSDANKSYELVGTGNAAMVWQGSWAVEAIKSKDPDLTVGYMAFPISDDESETKAILGSAGGFCVYNFEDPALLDAGLKLHETMLSSDSAGQFQEKALQIGSAKGLDMSFENAFAELQSVYLDGDRSVSYAGTNISFGTEQDAIWNEEVTKFAMGEYTIDQLCAALDSGFASLQ